MIKLIKSIEKNYDISVNADKFIKLGVTTINDIFVINNDTKKYILKMYNVDNEKQIRNSLNTQKIIFQSLKNTADVLSNKDGKLYTKYDNKFYAIQEFIEAQDQNNIDIIEESAKNLYLLHKEMKKLDQNLYENKKQSSNNFAIIENIDKSKKELKNVNISKKAKNIYDKLLNKRMQLLLKYNCEYFPNEFQVIHRDIRPKNIIINNNCVHFIDFDFVAYGDLLFEIGSSAMLISDFNIEKAKKFVKIYNSYLDIKYNDEKIFKNLLAYYVQSDFPIKLIRKVEDDVLIKFIDDRIKCLDFCEKMCKDNVVST